MMRNYATFAEIKAIVIIMHKEKTTEKLLGLIRNGGEMTLRQKLYLIFCLSIPAIIAQISSIAMQYIDASMVGHLGAVESASIGIISTTTWFFSCLSTAVSEGFSVQVAHKLGANEPKEARKVLRQSLIVALVIGLLLATIGVSISSSLPLWLGATPEVAHDASVYFLVFSLSLPCLQFIFLAGAMLRCSGNLRVPSMLNVLMCVLDVLFNFLFIFPSHELSVLGMHITIPGWDMGVKGAAIGTMLAETIVCIILLWYLCFRSKELHLTHEKGDYHLTKKCLKKAFVIGFPVGCVLSIMSIAHIVSTAIVAPLGMIPIAAYSFAITAESLCYMPGYGISEVATTLVGQSIGAGRYDLSRSFAIATVWCGVAVMAVMGALMYIFAPEMIGFLTPNVEIVNLGVEALRIEAFAEPMFAMSIVAYGAFVGAGRTVIPSFMNVGSMWAVRLTLAAILTPIMGFRGIWIAMCTELCFRGAIFLIWLYRGKWNK